MNRGNDNQKEYYLKFTEEIGEGSEGVLMVYEMDMGFLVENIKFQLQILEKTGYQRLQIVIYIDQTKSKSSLELITS